eukprot:TRINITY_DN44517_c0_g1_i1.p1 TRINITY_DN44517_c0_g1~~TRINITY_DN44517_c0_g1_i1.p1  ORF type:complete len:269 (+),score=45.54 TRINITY_DN44517_c0_g1_i1:358-1164(+)
MATEQSLQTLGTSLTARCLVKLGDEPAGALEQHLVFVVNLTTLKYDDDGLEKISNSNYEGPRAEVRQSVKTVFPRHTFRTVPIMGMPNFEESVERFRIAVLENRRQLVLGGVRIRRPQLRGLLELIVSEVQQTNQVGFPSVSRYVVLEGFLAPLVKQTYVKTSDELLPRLSEYDPDLASKHCRRQVLTDFEMQVAHVGHPALVEEARHDLQQKLDAAWELLEQTNEAFGNEIVEYTSESRDVVESTGAPSPLGGTDLLAVLPVRMHSL